MTTTVEADLIGASDDEQIAYALGETRAIVTHDHDFLALAAGGNSIRAFAIATSRSTRSASYCGPYCW